MEFIVNVKDRNIIIKKTPDSAEIIINEGDRLEYNFLPGTEDRFEVILIFIEVEQEDGTKILKPFTHRVDNPDWIIEFEASDYKYPEV